MKARKGPTDLEGATYADLLKFQALERAIERDGRVPRRFMKRFLLSQEGISVILQGLTSPALALQSLVMRKALKDKDLPSLSLGSKVAENILDRVHGKPTEKVVTFGAVRVIMSGLDPDAFPDPPTAALPTPKGGDTPSEDG